MRGEAADELERPGVSERNRLWERERLLAELLESPEQRAASEAEAAAHQHRALQHWAKTLGMDAEKEWTKEQVLTESERQSAAFYAKEEELDEALKNKLDDLGAAEQDAQVEIVALMTAHDSLMIGLSGDTFYEVEEGKFRLEQWKQADDLARAKRKQTQADRENLARELGIAVPALSRPDLTNARKKGA